MSRKIAPFGLRLPEQLRQMLEEAAKRNRRSMNAEVVTRLEQSLDFARRYPNVDALRVGGVVEGRGGYKNAELERELLELIRELTAEQKRALLVLLRR